MKNEGKYVAHTETIFAIIILLIYIAISRATNFKIDLFVSFIAQAYLLIPIFLIIITIGNKCPGRDFLKAYALRMLFGAIIINILTYLLIKGYVDIVLSIVTSFLEEYWYILFIISVIIDLIPTRNTKELEKQEN